MTTLALAEREVNLLGPAFDNLFIDNPQVPALHPAPQTNDTSPVISEIGVVSGINNIVVYDPSGTFHARTGDNSTIIVINSGTNSFSTNTVTSNIIYSNSTSTTTNIIYPGGPQIYINGVLYSNGTGSVFSTSVHDNWWRENTGVCGKVKPRPSVKKTVKNSIKRALKMLDNFGMEEDSKIFLNGQEVEISHPDSMFKFVITKRRYDNLLARTEFPIHSVPFSLELFTKTGIHIANLCVYAEDSPMLDQLFMVAMYVKSGNEEDLLRKANFFSVSRDIELKENIVGEIGYLKSKLLR
jgi:hypothetical protein